MVAYQIMVEGVFVELPGSINAAYGFHTTFYLEATSAKNAVQRVGLLMNDRLKGHQIRFTDSGMLKTYFWVHDIWEITSEKFKNNDTKNSGFAFFPIGWTERAYLYLRRLFFARFKPWLLIRLDKGKPD